MIALSKNPVCHQRCNSVDFKYHFVRSALVDGKIWIEYCPTADTAADIVIKPVTKVMLDRFVCFIFGMKG